MAHPCQMKMFETFQDFNLSMNASKVLPISLYLIDDYVHDYQIKGLICLCTILKNLVSILYSYCLFSII